MSIKYESGNLIIDLDWLLSRIKPEDMRGFLESASTSEAIIKYVTDQILDGWTENGYFGRQACRASDDPYTQLDKARREIAKRSGEVAKNEIEKLEKALKEQKDEYWKLVQEREGN